MNHVFGKYERIRRLAVGGMGEVFLARQTGVLDRLAILKSLRADLAQERDFVEQFLDEARVAATLNHPNIVSIFDVGEWNGTYYIAMEYVPGEDLSKLWYAAAKAGVGLPFQVSVRICYEAALGLDHAHKAKDVRGNPLNVVHRDVSPQNIMVRGDGVVKLVDFGIAKAANKSSRTQAGMVKGKLQYMSPEQVRGEALDGRSDQFSLGVVLWEMCTGRRLFKAENEVQTLNKILQAPIPKPSAHVPGFPAELESTILRMISREADHRFKHLGEVANDLKGYLDRSSISTGEVSVASFVQQILGKELEERTRDLTPMEPTEAGAPVPQQKSKGTHAKGAARPLAEKLVDSIQAAEERTDNPAPVSKIVMPAPEDRDTVALAESDRVRGEVRRQNGTTQRFEDRGVLRQWVLDGQLGPDDTFTTDGQQWQKVKDAKELSKFLEIANATREVSTSRSARPRGPEAPVDPPPATTEVTKPMPAVPAEPGAGGHVGPATLNLNVGSQPPATSQFSLGDLPPAMTGTWGAPDIAAAVHRKENGSTDTGATGIVMQTSAPQRVPTRVPTLVWMLGGVAGALLVVVAALAVLAPELLGLVVNGGANGAEVRKAIAVVQADDPAAIDSLLASVGSPGTKSADALSAAAILHVARARVDGSAVAIASLARELDPKEAPAHASAATAIENHRVAAYKLAGDARAEEDGVVATLAMAAYHAERGARTELDAEIKRAATLPAANDLKTIVDGELSMLQALVKGDAALHGRDAAGIRSAAQALEARSSDARARHAALVLWLAAAARTEGPAAKADVARARALRADLDAASSVDPRPAVASRVLKMLDERLKSAPAVEPRADAGMTSTVVARADAGPVGVVDGGGAAAAPPADGGVAVVDAGPPETYESALERGRVASRGGKPGAASRAFNAALRLKPGDIEATLGLGWAYIDLAKHEAAHGQFQRVSAKDPKRAEAYMGAGEALRALGRTEDAKAAFTKYLEIAPSGPDAEAAKNAIRQLE